MKFNYQAKTTSGSAIEGQIEAPSQDQAIVSLQQKGLFVFSVIELDDVFFKKDLFAFAAKPSNKDLVLFTRQLATLIDADVPLLEGLEILGRQAERESFHRVISEVRTAVEGGATLSIALHEHEKIFGAFYVSLIRVGEVSGKMQETLLYLADYLEHIAALNSKIRGALFYPAFVLSAMIAIAILMMTTVVPQLIAIIKDSGVTELPITTRILIAVSAFINSYFIHIIIGLIVIMGAFIYYIRTPGGKRVWDGLKISVPRFGKIARNLYIARFAETLAMLIRAGVPILESIDITSDVVGNEIYRAILLEAKTAIKDGGTLSDTLQRHKEFPPLVSAMVTTGEKTGRTEYMLATLQKFYKTEAENDIQNLSQLIEPILILLLGIGVGGLVSAILLPIYSLVNAG